MLLSVLACVFFDLLIVIAYTADRVNHYRVSQRMRQSASKEDVAA